MKTKIELVEDCGVQIERLANVYMDLRRIANGVEYLHPQLADELDELAKELSKASSTLQGNISEMLNKDIQQAEATAEVVLGGE